MKNQNLPKYLPIKRGILMGLAIFSSVVFWSPTHLKADEPQGWIEHMTKDSGDSNNPTSGTHTADFVITYTTIGTTQIGSWTGTAWHYAKTDNSESHITGDGSCNDVIILVGPTNWHVRASATGSYHYTLKVYWAGAGQPTSRPVDINATGSASESIAADCAPKVGNNGSASASGSTAATSGLYPTTSTQPANATINLTPITLATQYTATSSNWSVSGNIGIPTSMNAPTWSGNVSAATTQATTQTGTGSVTGTATFVAIGGTYNQTTDLPYTVDQLGTTTTLGDGNFTSNGRVSFSADSVAGSSAQ